MYIFAVALEDGNWHHVKSYTKSRANRKSTIKIWRSIKTYEDKKWTKKYHDPNPKKKSFGAKVIVTLINGKKIKVVSERDPAKLPWGDLGVDVVLECTGFFANKTKASAHIAGGAKKVLISAPAGNDIDATVVFGVNHHVLKASHEVVSNASCTTNCLAPLVKPLHESIGIESGIMTTIHSYTNDQVLTDVYHSDLRRARSATQSMIPTSTGAAAAV